MNKLVLMPVEEDPPAIAQDLFEVAVSDDGWETAGLDVQFKLVDHPVYGTIVAFQGSISKMDWRLNFDFAVIPYHHQDQKWFAHRGFVKAWKSVRDIIMPRLGGKYRIKVVGYSLGGALAQLCHEDIEFQYPGTITESWTYGAPRVFWFPPETIRYRMFHHHRFTNAGDIVPHLPPALFGFRHTGLNIWIGSLKGYLKSLFKMKSVYDLPFVRKHLVPSYRGGLSK